MLGALALVSVSVVDGSYPPGLASKLLHFAEASYCPDQRVAGWECPPCKLEPAFNVTRVLSRHADDTHGFVGYDSNENAVIAAFRGTDPLRVRSWMVDLESAVQVQYPYADCKGCQVAEGFYSAFAAIRNEAVSAVTKLVAQYPSARIMITGHSLGAAYATLLAMALLREGSRSMTVITFGLPVCTAGSIFRPYGCHQPQQLLLTESS